MADDGGRLRGRPKGPPPQDEPQIVVQLSRRYWHCIQGRYTAEAAARMLLATATMEEIRRCAFKLRMTDRQAHQERLRLFHVRYGI